MRRIGIYVAVAALAVSGGTAVVVKSYDGGSSRDDTSTGEAPRPITNAHHEPGQDGLTQRLGLGVPVDAYDRALAQDAQLTTVQQAFANAKPGNHGSDWTSRGPTNIGGRLVDVVQDPKNANIFYVAAAGGGVWRSTDGGRTFKSAWPTSKTQAIGAMTMGRDGTLWVGTGETNPGGGSTTFAGDGIYKSRDGGKKWTYAGLGDSRRISHIVVDPKNPKRVFAAVSGDLFRPGGERGLYRTENAGGSWQRVLSGANGTSGAVDFTLDPNDNKTMYATFWDHLRTPEVRYYGGPGSRAYKSTNGGTSWKQMTNGLPPASETTGRMGIAVAPTDSDRLYLIHVNRLGGFAGFFVSNDAGASWTRTPDTPLLTSSQSSYGWWFGKVWVSPDDANDVWVAGVPLIRSRDGGTTWGFGATQDVHVDHHALIWDSRNSDRIYNGNDGGFYRTTNDGVSWTKAEVEPYTQFYTIDVGEQAPSKITGGTQDNGCNRSYGEPHGWNTFACGDGLETLIAPDDDRYVYSCSQYGSCSRSEDGGDTNANFSGGTVSDRRNWKTPVEFDRTDPTVMYYAGNIVNRSTDRGKTWTAISPDLTSGPSADPQYPYGTVTTIAAAESDPERLYVGTDDARVWTSPDLGATWERVDAGLPERWVTRVRVDPDDAETVYVTLSGFRAGDAAAHVFRSDDAGQSWDNISGNLPNAPVNDMVLRGSQLYVANDIGVYLSTDNGRRWLAFGRNLPVTAMMELRVHEPSDTLFVASFGRGMYGARMPGRGDDDRN